MTLSTIFINHLVTGKLMMGFGKNMGILLLSFTVILTGATYLTTQNLDESLSILSSPNDSGFVMGHLTLTVLDENGMIKSYQQSDNVIVEHGWEALVQAGFAGPFINGIGDPVPGTSGAFTHIGIGTGLGISALSGSNEGLGIPVIGCPRSVIEDITTEGAFTDPDGSSSIAIELFASFTGIDCGGDPADPVSIDEAGIFNTDGSAPPGVGEMFARNGFTPVAPLGPLDLLELDWTITFTGAAPPGPPIP